jgi:hypothetical protein
LVFLPSDAHRLGDICKSPLVKLQALRPYPLIGRLRRSHISLAVLSTL